MVVVGRLARRGDKLGTLPSWRQFTVRESHRERWIHQAQTEKIKGSILYQPTATESRRLQIRGEFFNLTNHPNLDIPDHVLGSPTFGHVLSANAYGNKPPRQIQLGLKYSF